jgi:hypothetical protein
MRSKRFYTTLSALCASGLCLAGLAGVVVASPPPAAGHVASPTNTAAPAPRVIVNFADASGANTPDAPEAPLEEVLDSYPVDPAANGIVIDPEITQADLSQPVEFSSDTPVSEQRQLRRELSALSSGRAARSGQWSSFVIPPGSGLVVLDHLVDDHAE